MFKMELLSGIDGLHSFFLCFYAPKTWKINMMHLMYVFKYYNYVVVFLWFLTFFLVYRVREIVHECVLFFYVSCRAALSKSFQ
jgi:hypothetical protein